jgi:hypothetical protein
MKRNIRLTTLVIIGLLTFVGSTPTAHAKAKCTLAGVAGDWGFTDEGSVIGIGPRIALGRFTLDSAGNVLNGKATVNLNGTISSETFSGTITVGAHCTGSGNIELFDPSGTKVATITTQAVFLNNMREAREIFTSVVLANGTPLTTVITLDAKRLFPKDDNEH